MNGIKEVRKNETWDRLYMVWKKKRNKKRA